MRLFHWVLRRALAVDAAFEELEGLARAGLDEKSLRRMDPDDRVAALEGAGLDPYDYIFLAY